MENVKVFNNRLARLYGKALDGSPNFRLVWSEGLTEKRKGDFYKLTPSGLFLGLETGVVKEVRKYEYVKERWILEVYVPEQQKPNPELMASDGYEPLFIFWDKNRNYLKPEWFAIEYVVKRYQWAKSGQVPRRTEAMDKAEDDRALEAETKVFQDYLEQEHSNMSNKFRYQEAVIIHKES